MDSYEGEENYHMSLEEAVGLDTSESDNVDSNSSYANSMIEATEKLAEMTQTSVSQRMKSEQAFVEALQNFHSEQAEILKQAESKLPQACPTCNNHAHSDVDIKSVEEFNKCFSCYKAEEMHQNVLKAESIDAQKYALIGNMDFSDYEEWLFDDEIGHKSLAKIMTKLKREGYDYKPWQVSIGAAAWSQANYNNTDLSKTRYLVERVKINDLVEYIPANTDGIKTVIDSIKRAEDIMGVKHNTNQHWGLLAGIAGLSLTIPLLLKRR